MKNAHCLLKAVKGYCSRYGGYCHKLINKKCSEYKENNDTFDKEKKKKREQRKEKTSENVTNVVEMCRSIMNVKRIQRNCRSWRRQRGSRRYWMKIKTTWSTVPSQKRANWCKKQQKRYDLLLELTAPHAALLPPTP